MSDLQIEVEGVEWHVYRQGAAAVGGRLPGDAPPQPGPTLTYAQAPDGRQILTGRFEGLELVTDDELREWIASRSLDG